MIILSSPNIILKSGIEFAEPGGSLDAEKRGGLSGKFCGGASDLGRYAPESMYSGVSMVNLRSTDIGDFCFVWVVSRKIPHSRCFGLSTDISPLAI